MSIDLRVQLTAYRIALDHSEKHQMAQPGQRVGDADWQAHAGKAPDETDRPGRSAEFWAAAEHLGASLTSITGLKPQDVVAAGAVLKTPNFDAVRTRRIESVHNPRIVIGQIVVIIV